MVRRKNRPGYYYREMRNGRVTLRSLGTDYGEALRRLRTLKREGRPRSGKALHHAATHWLTECLPTTRNEKGVKLARQRYESWIEPWVGHLLLHRIDRNEIRWLRVQLEETHLSAQSIRHVLSDLRNLMNWCEESGWVDRAPSFKRLLPKLQERPPDRLWDEEVDKLVVLPDPFGYVIRLLLGTGLRWGELARAQASDIQNGMLVVHKTKSGKVRRVPLLPDLREELRGRLGRLIPFTNQQWLTDYCRRETGILRFHVHQLRHTFACRWLEAGGSLAALQEILGHASITTTQRYGRLSEAHVRAEAERIGGQLASIVVSGAGIRSC
jgi:integrase